MVKNAASDHQQALISEGETPEKASETVSKIDYEWLLNKAFRVRMAGSDQVISKWAEAQNIGEEEAKDKQERLFRDVGLKKAIDGFSLYHPRCPADVI